METEETMRCTYGKEKQRRANDSGQKARCSWKGREGNGQESPGGKKYHEDINWMENDGGFDEYKDIAYGSCDFVGSAVGVHRHRAAACRAATAACAKSAGNQCEDWRKRGKYHCSAGTAKAAHLLAYPQPVNHFSWQLNRNRLCRAVRPESGVHLQLRQ